MWFWIGGDVRLFELDVCPGQGLLRVAALLAIGVMTSGTGRLRFAEPAHEVELGGCGVVFNHQQARGGRSFDERFGNDHGDWLPVIVNVRCLENGKRSLGGRLGRAHLQLWCIERCNHCDDA